jgi:16S rRNA C967 or C1407 C5-methylase (RsmB/RsmF family)/NOL1/NOP2/fmu family ribosome biogenesis protein
MAAGKGVNESPIPADFIHRMNIRYGENECRDLCAGLMSDPSVSVQLNPTKRSDRFSNETVVPWYPHGRLLTARPAFTLDPLYHAGAYYSQESSSMFLAHALESLYMPDTDGLRALDLCAAPGGKSLLLAHFLHQRGVLICNEINKQRNSVLIENMTKSGCHNYAVASASADAWGQMPGYFDVVLVDAPCSGEGMFRKDMQARTEWSLANVEMCAARQREILTKVLPAIKPGGYLIYSTCTFAPQENEEIVQFLMDDYQMEPLDLQPPTEWNIDEVGTDHLLGYRFWPHRIPGEGLFMTVLRAPQSGHMFHRIKPKPLFQLADKHHIPVIRSFVEVTEAVMDGRGVYHASPLPLDELNHWAHFVYFTAPGCVLGEVKRTDFIPDAALALVSDFQLHADTIPLSHEEALSYLRGESLDLPAGQGWAMITCEGLGVGWVKRMGQRSNNYFPKEWRIRMR